MIPLAAAFALFVLVNPNDCLHFDVNEKAAEQCASIAWRHLCCADEKFGCFSNYCKLQLWRRDCWQELDWALYHFENHKFDQCIVRLVALRKLLGPEWYYGGFMPDPVPLERFTEINNPAWRPPQKDNSEP